MKRFCDEGHKYYTCSKAPSMQPVMELAPGPILTSRYGRIYFQGYQRWAYLYFPYAASSSGLVYKEKEPSK